MVSAHDILRHAAGELDICHGCGHTGQFGSIPLEIGGAKRCRAAAPSSSTSTTCACLSSDRMAGDAPSRSRATERVTRPLEIEVHVCRDWCSYAPGWPEEIIHRSNRRPGRTAPVAHAGRLRMVAVSREPAQS